MGLENEGARFCLEARAAIYTRACAMATTIHPSTSNTTRVNNMMQTHIITHINTDTHTDTHYETLLIGLGVDGRAGANWYEPIAPRSKGIS